MKTKTRQPIGTMKAYRIWNHITGEIYWVAQLKQPKKAGCKDWGYTSSSQLAIQLTLYWQRRFAADCRYVGSEAHFV